MDDERKAFIARFLRFLALRTAMAENNQSMVVTPETLAELKALGIPLPGNFKVMSLDDVQNSGEVSTIVCEVVEPFKALVMPDNLTAPCDLGCGRTIQFRPDMANTKIPKACVTCATGRVKSVMQ